MEYICVKSLSLLCEFMKFNLHFFTSFYLKKYFSFHKAKCEENKIFDKHNLLILENNIHYFTVYCIMLKKNAILPSSNAEENTLKTSYSNWLNITGVGFDAWLA